MAQLAAVQANGDVPGPEPVREAVLPVKRKREVSVSSLPDADDDSPPRNGDDRRDDPARKRLTRSYFAVLSCLDINPPILKRPLPAPTPSEEPQVKRQKPDDADPDAADDADARLSVADKVQQGAYPHPDDLAVDILAAADDQLEELKAAASDGAKAEEIGARIVQTRNFRTKALDIFLRETSYPGLPNDRPSEKDSIDPDGIRSQASGIALTMFAHNKQLFSSLQRKTTTAANPDGEYLPINADALPPSVSVTHILKTVLHERPKTLGELYAPTRTLKPLSPPKLPKNQHKAIGFYHPELVDKSKYRDSAYCGQRLSVGQYLDYSNATPASQTKPKQRERAQSLAGHKPSTTELEMSEMEALFRGAFSSFAPCKDDAAALVPASQTGRMWWQRVGHKSFGRLIDVYEDSEDDATEETAEVAGVKSDAEPKTESMEIDERFIEASLESWDESLVDPSLSDVLPEKKSKEEMEVDELLDEVSDLIATLASHQKNRHLVPPSSNRYLSDPGNQDMLSNGPGPQPSEDEQNTYEVLKAQLSLIISMLPPYAVAKLRGDQDEDLLISTKVEVRSDVYRGVMEEDESAARARQQAAAQVAAPRPSAHRTSSISSVGSFTPQQAQANHYATPTRTPMPVQPFHRGPAAPVQHPNSLHQPRFPMAHQPPRPLPNHQPYRAPSGHTALASQLAKAQTPFGHQSAAHYGSQPRPQPHHGYITPSHASPTGVRHSSGNYAPAYPPQSTPSHPQYTAYTNGAGSMPQRKMSPQVQPAYGAPIHQRPSFATPTPAPQMAGHMASRPGMPMPQPSTPVAYHYDAQQRADQQNSLLRHQAQQARGFGDKMAQAQVSGLAGIGLGLGGHSQLDVAKIAAVRAQHLQQQPPRPAMNGSPMPITHKVSPVPLPPLPGTQGLEQQQKPSVT